MQLCDSRDIANRILVNVHRREKTDTIIEPKLVLVVMLSFLVLVNYMLISLFMSTRGTDVELEELFFNLGLYLVLHLLIVLAGFYLLMRRNERHSAREAELRSLIIDYFRCHVEDRDIQKPLRKMIEMDGLIRRKERPVPTLKMAALIALPLIGTVMMLVPSLSWFAITVGIFLYLISFLVLLYVIRNVTNFSFDHDRRWMTFQRHVLKASEAIGLKVGCHCERTVGMRSFMLFIFISYATGGLFFPIWLWLILKDMNRHFQEQWALEESLIEGLREMESSPRSWGAGLGS